MSKKKPQSSTFFQVFDQHKAYPQTEEFQIHQPKKNQDESDDLDGFFQNPVSPEELLNPSKHQASKIEPQNTPLMKDNQAQAFLSQLTPVSEDMRVEDEDEDDDDSFEDEDDSFEDADELEKPNLFLSRLLLLLSFSFLLVISYQTATSFSGFKIQHFAVVGNEKIDSDELISYLQLKKDKENFFKIDVKPIEKKLKEHPWVADFKIEKHFPNYLKIEVKEKKTKGVALLGSLMAVDESGMPFVAITPKERKNLPIISGLPQSIFDDPKTQKIGQLLMSKAIYTYELYEKSNLKKYKKLSDIYVSQTGRIELMLDHTRVSLGNDHFKQRIAYLEKILGYLYEQDRNVSYILLSEDLSKAIVEESSFDTQSLLNPQTSNHDQKTQP